MRTATTDELVVGGSATDNHDTPTIDASKKEPDDTLPIAPPGAALLYRNPGRHVRAGITKNKSRGVPKAKRRMAKASRERNRRR